MSCQATVAAVTFIDLLIKAREEGRPDIFENIVCNLGLKLVARLLTVVTDLPPDERIAVTVMAGYFASRGDARRMRVEMVEELRKCKNAQEIADVCRDAEAACASTMLTWKPRRTQ